MTGAFPSVGDDVPDADAVWVVDGVPAAFSSVGDGVADAVVVVDGVPGAFPSVGVGVADAVVVVDGVPGAFSSVGDGVAVEVVDGVGMEPGEGQSIIVRLRV